MPRIDETMIAEARKVDLLSYLQAREPYELVPCSGGYCTRTHDSLKISNGMWMWWSRGIGGKSALDYLMKVRGMNFCDAVAQIAGTSAIAYEPPTERKPQRERELRLPPLSDSTDGAFEYLLSRGISVNVIRDCIEKELIYESLPYHNIVFIGTDEQGKARYAAYRATGKARIMGDCPGSDKRYSFRLVNPDSDCVHIFESAIDALSYATLIEMNDGDYRNESLISLAGVYTPARDGTSKTPAVITNFLECAPGVRKIYLHLDNDMAGRKATAALIQNLKDKYEVIDKPPKHGKDINDYLRYRLGMDREKRSYER